MDREQIDAYENLAPNLLTTLSNSDLAGLGVDTLVKELAPDLVDEVPVVRALLRISNSITDWLYTKKVIRFLAEFSDIPPQERQQQVARMTVDHGEEKKFGEHIILLLDRLNDIDKASLVGKVARAFLSEQISMNELLALNDAIDRMDMRDVEFVRKRFTEEKPVNRDTPVLADRTITNSFRRHTLERAGFTELYYARHQADPSGGIRESITSHPRWTDLAGFFARVCLGIKFEWSGP